MTDRPTNRPTDTTNRQGYREVSLPINTLWVQKHNIPFLYHQQHSFGQMTGRRSSLSPSDSKLCIFKDQVRLMKKHISTFFFNSFYLKNIYYLNIVNFFCQFIMCTIVEYCQNDYLPTFRRILSDTSAQYN